MDSPHRSSEDAALLTAYADIRIMLEQRQLEQAAESCNAILRQYPRNPVAHELMGDIYASRRSWAEAVEWYTMAERLGAGGTIADKRAAAAAYMHGVSRREAAAPISPELRQQRTRTLAMFAGAAAIVVVAVGIALTAVYSGRGPSGTVKVSSPPSSGSRFAPAPSAGSTDTSSVVGPRVGTTPVGQKPSGAGKGVAVQGEAVSGEDEGVTGEGEAPGLAAPGTARDTAIRKAISSLAWPDGTRMSRDVGVLVRGDQNYGMISFELPPGLPTTNASDTVLQQSYDVALAALNADPGLQAVTLRVLKPAPLDAAQTVPTQVFGANITRDTVKSWTASSRRPTSEQLRGQVFGTLWMSQELEGGAPPR